MIIHKLFLRTKSIIVLEALGANLPWLFHAITEYFHLIRKITNANFFLSLASSVGLALFWKEEKKQETKSFSMN